MVFSLTDTHVPSTLGNKSSEAQTFFSKVLITILIMNVINTTTNLKMGSQFALESMSRVIGVPAHLQHTRLSVGRHTGDGAGRYPLWGSY